MKFTLRTQAAAAMLVLAPLGAALVAQPAAAQVYTARVARSDQGTINNLSLNSDGGLRPGATLRVQMYGTPGARWATVALGDDVRIPLHERAPGEYVGTHVIRRGEHLDPTRLMTARAGWGEGPVALAFNYPPSFQQLAMGAAPAMANAEVNNFAMWPRHDDDLDPGRVVHFRVEGTPHARAWVEVPGLDRGVRLSETRPGVYVGSYTIRRHDDRDSFRDARAVLRNGDQRVVAQLNRDDDHDR